VPPTGTAAGGTDLTLKTCRFRHQLSILSWGRTRVLHCAAGKVRDGPLRSLSGNQSLHLLDTGERSYHGNAVVCLSRTKLGCFTTTNGAERVARDPGACQSHRHRFGP